MASADRLVGVLTACSSSGVSNDWLRISTLSGGVGCQGSAPLVRREGECCAVHSVGEETHLCARWRTNLRAGGLDRGLDRAGSVGADTCANRLVVDRRLGCRRHRHLRARADAQPVQGVWRCQDLRARARKRRQCKGGRRRQHLRAWEAALHVQGGGTGTSLAASPSSSSLFLAKIGPHENRRRKVSIYGWPGGWGCRGRVARKPGRESARA